MERLSDILSSVKERITNPFLVSFVILLCTYNWKIFVALTLADTQSIYASGTLSIFEFIQKQIDEGFFWTPLGLAVAYSVGAPFVYSGISILNALAIKFGNKYIIKNSNTTPINFEKFMELKEKHKATTDKYSELLTTESETQKQLATKTTELNDALTRNTESQKEYESAIAILKQEKDKALEDLRNDQLKIVNKVTRGLQDDFNASLNSSALNGVWKVTPQSYPFRSQVVRVVDGILTDGKDEYKIKNFLMKAVSSQVIIQSFTLVKDNVALYFSLRLNPESNPDVLRGSVNNQDIEFEAISDAERS